jgi:hypothetical protein
MARDIARSEVVSPDICEATPIAGHGAGLSMEVSKSRSIAWLCNTALRRI